MALADYFVAFTERDWEDGCVTDLRVIEEE